MSKWIQKAYLKIKLLNDIDCINNNLHITSGNALNYDDYTKCSKYFDSNKKLAIINEGLLRYLTFDEKRVVATNVYNYLKRFTNDKIIYEIDKTHNDISDNISKDLIKRGMKFVGTTIIYSYLQAIGIIYSHDKECYLYKE